jgi:hypothetical protein
LNDLEINDGTVGVDVTGNGTGTLNMTVNDTTINDSTTTGFSVDNIDAGSIQVNNTTINGNNVGATAAGVLISNSNASFTFDSNTVIREWGGTDFEVDSGAGTISMQGDIVNSSTANAGDTTGMSVHARSTTTMRACSSRTTAAARSTSWARTPSTLALRTRSRSPTTTTAAIRPSPLAV